MSTVHRANRRAHRHHHHQDIIHIIIHRRLPDMNVQVRRVAKRATAAAVAVVVAVKVLRLHPTLIS